MSMNEGSSTITIEVERFAVIRQDRYELPCVHLIPEDQVREGEEGELVYIEVDCDCWGYYMPAKLCGPPEDCYPEEGDFEVQNVTLPADMRDYQFELTEAELSEAEDSFFSQDGPEPDYDYPDDDYDYDYDVA
jgi:hypothetical protein